MKKGKERCRYLCRLTGVSEKAIWEWGYLRTISTAFVLLQIGQKETGQKMLRVAECWAAEPAELEYMNELHQFLSCEYDFRIENFLPAKRGFYGETWNVQTENGKFFLKIDYWNHHKKGFHITHGDAGGNCILNKNQLFLVDWDSVMLAPIERDAWIFICDKNELEIINSVLTENGIDYSLDQNRLCYYCFDFFFHYLNEYLKSILGAESEEQKKEITQSLIGYLTDCWIYKRLETADTLSVCMCGSAGPGKRPFQ